MLVIVCVTLLLCRSARMSVTVARVIPILVQSVLAMTDITTRAPRYVRSVPLFAINVRVQALQVAHLILLY